LESGSLPKYVLWNHMFWGLLPEEFHDLTWVEEMVCTMYRCTIQVSHLYGKASDKHQPRVFHGNTCVHDLNLVSTVTVLPWTPADVNSLLGVVFVGPKQSIKSCLGTVYKIQKEKVWQFLLWLSKNNPLYESIRLCKEHLNMYADDNVIPGLEAQVIHEEQMQEESDLMFEKETAGFEQHFAGVRLKL
ncbi:hypothetical protein EDD85DRAFT_782349, partial [Armillaria nabsnona]